MHITLTPLPGDDFGTVALSAYRRALVNKESVDFRFNGVLFVVVPVAIDGMINEERL